MAYLETYITSSTLGRLNLSAHHVDLGFKNNVSSPDFPSKITTSDVVGSTDLLGWENPIVSIQGAFDEYATPKLNTLRSFRRSTEQVLIYDPVYFTAGTQAIQITTLNFTRDVTGNISDTGSDQVKGTILNYTLTATLTE